MEVTAPDGRTWAVRRRWLPHREGRGLRARLRQRRAEIAARRDSPDPQGWSWLDPFVWIPDEALPLALLAVLVGVVVFVLLGGVPLLLAVLDLVVLLVLAVAGVLGRLVLRRPWTVEAVASDGERRVRHVVGWRRAGQAADAWRAELLGG